MNPGKLAKLRLSPQENKALSLLMDEVRKIVPGAGFILFGSKATGTGEEESDLDLLVELPIAVSEDLRRCIIHLAFEINLVYGSNISVLIVSRDDWENGLLAALPIHVEIDKEGIPL
ncbi:MAG: nucleotidyltransferase domain-containing protein [Deltaproteobacteria bacterium]|nr:nucleotidyltransferase domain-containing protein [Deltaproteobacteria bacterium]